MTCASHAAPLERSSGSSLLRGLLTHWRRLVAILRTEHRLATLDDHALCDLGLSRDVVEPHHPRDAADIWLTRIPG